MTGLLHSESPNHEPRFRNLASRAAFPVALKQPITPHQSEFW
ncbi:hypothetical protein ACVJGD_006870 [Bradyrhizobium sp. USDA 10063]